MGKLVRLAALYRAFGWLATRFHALTPPMQSGWMVSRTPLKPAKRTLHEQMAARKTRGECFDQRAPGSRKSIACRHQASSRRKNQSLWSVPAMTDRRLGSASES